MENLIEKKFYYQEEKNEDEISEMISSFQYKNIFYKATTLKYIEYYKLSLTESVNKDIKFYNNICSLDEYETTSKIEILRFSSFNESIIERLIKQEKKKKSYLMVLTNDEIKDLDDSEYMGIDVFNTMRFDIDALIISYNVIEKKYRIAQLGSIEDIIKVFGSISGGVSTFLYNHYIANSEEKRNIYLLEKNNLFNEMKINASLPKEFQYLKINRYYITKREDDNEVVISESIFLPKYHKILAKEFKNKFKLFVKNNNYTLIYTDYRSNANDVFFRVNTNFNISLLCYIYMRGTDCKLMLGIDSLESKNRIMSELIYIDESLVFFTTQTRIEGLSWKDNLNDMRWMDRCEKEIDVILEYYKNIINYFIGYYEKENILIINPACYVKRR